MDRQDAKLITGLMLASGPPVYWFTESRERALVAALCSAATAVGIILVLGVFGRAILDEEERKAKREGPTP